MAYNTFTDFLALLRQTASGVETARTPGLDYLIAALARAGLFSLSIGQTPPTANQPSTVWLVPANPSWTAEGKVFLWNAATQSYQLATPALWEVLLVAPTTTTVFQSAAASANVVNVNTTLLAIQRNAPVATALTLPSVASRAGKALQIVDWSAAVVAHQITVSGPEVIMKGASLNLFSTTDQLAGVTLYPSIDLNGWVIAP